MSKRPTGKLKGGLSPAIGKATQFKVGQISNPSGRGGKLKLLRDAYQAQLSEIDRQSGLTNAQVIARRVIMRAKRGVMSAVHEVTNRTEGKPTQPVELDVNISEETARTLADLATKLLGP